MKLTEKKLKRFICETINEYFYGDDEESGDLNISLEDLIGMMPDSEVKNRLVTDSDLIDELLPSMAFEYSIDLTAERHESRGDYWTQPDLWFENRSIRDDDGLLDNINSVQDEELRNGLLQAYRTIENGVKNGDYDEAFC